MIFALIVGVVLAGLLVFVMERRSNPAVQLRKAEAEEAAGRTDAALKRFERVVALVDEGKGKPEEREDLAARAHLAAAAIEREQGLTSRAARHYREAKKCGATLDQAAVLLLAEQFATDRETGEEAIETYLTYLHVGSGSGAAAAQVFATVDALCQVSEEMKPAQRKAAAELNRRVLAANPRVESSHYYLALASLLEGKTQEAIQEFGRARDLNASRPLTWYWLAVCQLQLPAPDVEAACALVDRFLAFPSHDPKSQRREAQLCREIARRLVEQTGGYAQEPEAVGAGAHAVLERAIRYLRIASQRQPDSAEDLYNLGRIYRLQRNHAEAIASLRRAAEMDPRDWHYPYQLGVEHLDLGELPKAIEALDRALRIEPRCEPAHAVLGEIQFHLGEHANAASHLRGALEAGGANLRRLGLLVCSLHALGQYQPAVESIANWAPEIKAFPGDAEASLVAGSCFLRTGRLEQAIAWLKPLAGRPDAAYFLGCAYARAKQFDAARNSFDALVAGGGAWVGRAA
ncbi:MAG: tetratricopeptide repeat protein, partial [Terracidiphilus sp.]